MLRNSIIVKLVLILYSFNLLSMQGIGSKDCSDHSKILLEVKQAIAKTGLTKDLRALVATYVGNLHTVLNTPLPETINEFTDFNLRCFDLTFDGKTLLATDPKNIYIWDLDTNTLKHILAEDYAEKILLSPDNKNFAVQCLFTPVKIFDLNTLKFEQIKTDKRNLDFAYSPDNQYLTIGSTDSSIDLYDTKTYSFVKNILKYEDNERAKTCSNELKFTSNGKYLASLNDADKCINIWETKTYILSKKIDRNFPLYDKIHIFAFSNDGALLSYSQGSKIYFFDMNSLEPLETKINFEFEKIKSIDFSKNFLVTLLQNRDYTKETIEIRNLHFQNVVKQIIITKFLNYRIDPFHRRKIKLSHCGQYLILLRENEIQILMPFSIWISDDIDKINIEQSKET